MKEILDGPGFRPLVQQIMLERQGTHVSNATTITPAVLGPPVEEDNSSNIPTSRKKKSNAAAVKNVDPSPGRKRKTGHVRTLEIHNVYLFIYYIPALLYLFFYPCS